MNTPQEEIIFRSEDEYSEISVTEHAMIRNLYFGNNKKQSSVFVPEPSVLILPYSQAMMLSVLFKPRPENILLIGLGGGGIVQFLRKAFPKCAIDVVELRSHVIDLCHEFFLMPKGLPNLQIHHGDAKDYVDRQLANPAKKYDIILLDAFDQHGPADINNDVTFLQHCRKLLTNDGVFCSNLWNRREDVYHRWYARFSKQFDQKSLQLRLGKINSNVVVFGFPEQETKDQLSQLKDDAELQKTRLGVDFPKYLDMLVNQNLTLLHRIKNVSRLFKQ